MFPKQIKIERTHQRASEIARRVGVQPHRAGMVINNKAKHHLRWKLRECFVAPPKNRPGTLVVNALQIIEKMRSRDPALHPKARPIGYRAVGDERDSAVVVPNSLV